MPSAPLHYCGPTCNELVIKGRCKAHSHSQTRDAGVHYGRRWGKVRAHYLADHPFCVDCYQQGEMVFATEVDHIIPHQGNAQLMWDETNFQSLCKSHHSAKTRRETVA